MKTNNQTIKGDNNVQVAGDYIITSKISKTTTVLHDPCKHISDAQAKEVKDRVSKIAEAMKGDRKNNKSPFASAYNALYNRYHITSYKLLPIEDYDDAIKWLDKQIAIYRPKLKNIDVVQYRKDMYKSLHARAKQLNINIYDFAQMALELKEPITSLTDLSDMRLKKLYTKLFSNKKR